MPRCFKDDSHTENVGPLVDILRAANVDLQAYLTGTAVGDNSPQQWRAIARRAARANPGLGTTESILFDIVFALGYLQATSNLTHQATGDQLRAIATEVQPCD